MSHAQLSEFGRVVGLGMGVWVLAAAGSGVSTGFWTLLIARIFVGAGKLSLCRPCIHPCFCSGCPAV